MACVAARSNGAAGRFDAVAGGNVGWCGGCAMVTIDNLTVSYRQHPALHHISGVLAPGSLTAVVGPNG